MTVYCAPARNPTPLYFAEVSYGPLGIEFPALDRDHNSRAEIIRLIREKRTTVIRVFQAIEPCDEYPTGQFVDVTDELVAAAAQPREPLEAEVLRGMLIDHERDLLHDGLYGRPA